MGIFRWLGRNLGTLLLASVLSLIVWVSAVMSKDPNEEQPLSRAIPIEVLHQDPGLHIMDAPELSVNLTLKAPQSVWNELIGNEELIRAWIDLSNLDAGEHSVPVNVEIGPSLVRVVSQEPETITLTLESLVTRVLPVNLTINGSPSTGYTAEPPNVNPAEVAISGPQSIVLRVSEVRANLDISGASETISKSITPTLLDDRGRAIPTDGLTITPDTVSITQPISLLGGFRYVIVRAVTLGQLEGYRLTNITVTPAGVVVFSSDPQLVQDLPGYIETKSIDLTGAEDDFEVLVDLNLPEGISVVGDPKVLVQVSISAIEGNLAVSLPVEVVALTPGLMAQVSPIAVDVILTGPVPLLGDLQSEDIRVKVDLTGYEVGIYQIIPVVDFLPERVKIESILPPTVEVIISQAPTPSPTLTPLVSPTPTVTPTP
jgi:YbbR domain-containing protein